MNKIKILFATVIASVIVLVTISCNRNDADYVLYVGEGFTIGLVENFSAHMLWEWEDSDKTDVVSMVRVSDNFPDSDSTTAVSDTTDTIDGLPSMAFFCFRAEKKGYTVVRMVYGKDEPKEYQRRINFSIRVIE